MVIYIYITCGKAGGGGGGVSESKESSPPLGGRGKRPPSYKYQVGERVAVQVGQVASLGFIPPSAVIISFTT